MIPPDDNGRFLHPRRIVIPRPEIPKVENERTFKKPEVPAPVPKKEVEKTKIQPPPKVEPQVSKGEDEVNRPQTPKHPLRSCMKTGLGINYFDRRNEQNGIKLTQFKAVEAEIKKSIKDLSDLKSKGQDNTELKKYADQLTGLLKKMINYVGNNAPEDFIDPNIVLSLDVINKDFFSKMKKRYSNQDLRLRKILPESLPPIENRVKTSVTPEKVENNVKTSVTPEKVENKVKTSVTPEKVENKVKTSVTPEKVEHISKKSKLEHLNKKSSLNKKPDSKDLLAETSTDILETHPLVKEEPPGSSLKKTDLQCPNTVCTVLRETVKRAVAQHKIFTIHGNFETIRNALLSRNWIEKIHPTVYEHLNDKAKKIFNNDLNELLEDIKKAETAKIGEMLFKSKLLEYDKPDFYWGPNANTAFKDMQEVTKPFYVNQFILDVNGFTTKQGLSNFQEIMHWFQKDKGTAYKLTYPRSYNLDSASDVEDFYQDYQITAAISLLKWIVNVSATREIKVVSSFGQIPMDAFHFACNECYKYIKKRKHEDIDIVIPSATPYEWAEFLKYYYNATRHNHHFKEELPADNHTAIVSKSSKILKILNKYCSTIDIDGVMNLWILKPIFGSCGRAIRICEKLNYIQNMHEQTKHRYVVQKYIEKPLLINKTKFDIRQWFLISSIRPLTIWMYKDCYLRFSSALFNLRRLDESIHLTNNSIQKKYEETLRETELPKYNMWTSTQFKIYLANIGHGGIFDTKIYPEMKKSIIAAVLMNQSRFQARGRAFQFFGADFMMDQSFRTYLIEINSQPAMGGTTPVTAMMCPQAQEDTIKVIIDRANNSNASTGRFELIYEQKNTNTPEIFEVPDLKLEGTQVKLIPGKEASPLFELLNDSNPIRPDKRTALKEILQEIVIINEKLSNTKNSKTKLGPEPVTRKPHRFQYIHLEK